MRDKTSWLLDKGKFIEINYVKNAESVGVCSWIARTDLEVKNALSEARQEPGSCMIVVPTEKYRSPPGSDVWWEVVGSEVTQDPKTSELVNQRELGREKQKFYY